MKDLANNRALGIKAKLKPSDDPEKRFIECPKCFKRFQGPERAIFFENHFAIKHGAPQGKAILK